MYYLVKSLAAKINYLSDIKGLFRPWKIIHTYKHTLSNLDSQKPLLS